MTDLTDEVGAAPAAGPREGAVAHPEGPATTYRLPPHRPGLRRRIRRKVLRLMRRWRTSLAVRVVSTIVVGGLVAIAIVGALLSVELRDGLYEERVAQVLEDAAVQTRGAQETFDSATATTGPQIQQVANDWVAALPLGSEALGAVLRRSPDPGGIAIPEPASTVPIDLRGLITPELRTAVNEQSGQHWQPVALPTAEGDDVPGIMVGAPVSLPVAGTYELYLFYSLGTEDRTISLLLRGLTLGSLGVIVLLGGLTWVIARWVLRPVTDAVRAAHRLADGRLDERMDVRGRDELALLGQSFNEMATSLQRQIERMEELSRVQQRFVSDVSHELRTPLTTIRMAGEVLHDARDTFDPAARRSAELLHAQVERFEAMLADLLEISRFDAGAAVLDVEDRDLRDIVRHVADLTAILAEASGSELRLHLPAEPAVAAIDSRRIERVIRNLVSNAVEHGEGQPVDITVGTNEHAVAVRVRDYGVGMDLESAQHAFDRFWRADPARARTSGGTGLGLAIAQEDTRLHGGILQAWGRRDEGASFLLTLPRRAGASVTAGPLALAADDVETEHAALASGSPSPKASPPLDPPPEPTGAAEDR